MMSSRRQRFSFDIGRVSSMRTTSPSNALFSSSCTWKRLELAITRRYNGCAFFMSTFTTMVLFILVLTTSPTLVARPAFFVSAAGVAIGYLFPDFFADFFAAFLAGFALALDFEPDLAAAFIAVFCSALPSPFAEAADLAA